MIANGPLSLRFTLEAVAAGLEMPFDEAQLFEATQFGLICTSEDMKEGTRAFLEKRPAAVQGPLMVRATAGAARPQAKSAPAGLPDGRGLKVVVLRSSFNAGMVDGLLEGALAALEEMGTSRAKVTVVDVPGAFELPLAAQAAARGQKCDAVIALGAVIRGQTDHYEHIARAATDGLARGGPA